MSMMHPGQLEVLDLHRVLVTPGQKLNEEEIMISGGGFHALYRGELTDLMEKCLFRRCLKDAISKVFRDGSDLAVQVANQWINSLCARTNNNR